MNTDEATIKKIMKMDTAIKKTQDRSAFVSYNKEALRAYEMCETGRNLIPSDGLRRSAGRNLTMSDDLRRSAGRNLTMSDDLRRSAGKNPTTSDATKINFLNYSL